MRKIFESRNYPTVMYLLITAVLLMIIFSLADYGNEYSKINNNKQKSVTGLTVKQEKINTENSIIYSLKSYLIYYVVITLLIAGIFATITKVISREP